MAKDESKQNLNALPVIYTPDDIDIISKPNVLVTAKYKMGLMAQKLFNLGLSKVEIIGNNEPKSLMYASEIRTALGKRRDDYGNIYTELKFASVQMQGSIVIIEDGRGSFNSVGLVTGCKYKDGKFEMTWHKDLIPILQALKRGGYTQLKLPVLLSFSEVTTLRLFELLSKDVYRLPLDSGKETKIYVTYNLSELRAELGLIDTQKDYIRRMRETGKTWDAIVSKCRSGDQRHARWVDFKSRVLDVGKRGIAEVAEFAFDYEPVKGARNKVCAIRFAIWRQDRKENPALKVEEARKRMAAAGFDVDKQGRELEDIDFEKPLVEESADNKSVYLELRKYLVDRGKDPRGFTESYFEAIYKSAGYDKTIIMDNIDLSARSGYIKNFYGWLRSAVKDRYDQSENVPTLHGSTENARAYDEITKKVNEKIAESAPEIFWKKIKKKENFGSFLDYCDMTLEQMEYLCSIKDCMSMYIEYDKSGHVDLRKYIQED